MIFVYITIFKAMSEAYELLDKIMDKQAKSISEKVKNLFCYKSKTCDEYCI